MSEQQQHHEKTYKIVVNGTPTTVEEEVLSFDDVVNLAFPARDPNTIYSVSFEHRRSQRRESFYRVNP